MHTCMHCSLTALALILLYGGHCSSVWFPSKVMLRFPHIMSGFLHHVRLLPSHNNTQQQMMISLDIIVTAKWLLPVCCYRELTERVLEFLELVSTDDLKRPLMA